MTTTISTPPAKTRFLTLKQVSEYLGNISARTVRAWTQRPSDPLPAVRPGRKILISEESLHRWLARQNHE